MKYYGRPGGLNDALMLSIFVIVAALLIGVGVAVMAGGGGLSLPAALAETTATLPPTLTASPTSTAMPTSTSLPTSTPTSTASPTPLPTATPTVTPTPVPAATTDGAEDLFDYQTLAPVTYTVSSADIQAASFDGAGRWTASAPPEVASQLSAHTEGETLPLWVSLQAPLPITVTRPTYWLFALDTDAELTTGRPVGDGAINPDMGAELTAGVYCDPANGIQFEPYLLVWDVATEEMARYDVSADVTFTSDRRTLILILPRAALADALVERAQVEPQWERVVGRAAAMTSADTGMIIDFCPDLPQP